MSSRVASGIAALGLLGLTSCSAPVRPAVETPRPTEEARAPAASSEPVAEPGNPADVAVAGSAWPTLFTGLTTGGPIRRCTDADASGKWNGCTDLTLGPGVGCAWGVALDRAGNLYVSAGSDVFHVDRVLKVPVGDAGPDRVATVIAPSAGSVFRSLAVGPGDVLYVADFGKGEVLKYPLPSGPATVLAKVPGAFGLHATGKPDDLYVTSNGGSNGTAETGGLNGIVHVAAGRPPQTCATGLPFPEGITGSRDRLFVAAGGGIMQCDLTSAGCRAPVPFAAPQVQASHGLLWRDGFLYATASVPAGQLFKLPAP